MLRLSNKTMDDESQFQDRILTAIALLAVLAIVWFGVIYVMSRIGEGVIK